MPRENSAGAIIFRMVDGPSTGLGSSVPHYLLLHYHSGHWEFARGHGEPGESEEKTVRREIYEETGLKDIKIIPGFKEYSKFVFKRTYNLKPEEKKKAPWIFKIVTLYLAQTHTGKVVLSHEHKGFAWLPYQEAHKKLLKNGKEILKKADDFIVLRKSVSSG